MFRLHDPCGRFLFAHLRPHRWPLFCAFLLSILAGLYPSINSYAMKLLVDCAMQPKALFEDYIGQMLWPLGLMLLCFEGINILWRVYDIILMRVLPLVRAEAMTSLYVTMEHQGLHFFQRYYAGTLANRIADLSRSLTVIVQDALYCIVQKIAIVVIAIASMAWIHPIFTFILVVWSLMMVLLSLWLARIAHRTVEEFTETRSRWIGEIVDRFFNILTLLTYPCSRREQARWAGYRDRMVRADRASQWLFVKIRYFQGLSLTAAITAISFTLTYYQWQGHISVGDFVFILSLALTVARYIWQITSDIGALVEQYGACSNALAVIREAAEATGYQPRSIEVRDEVSPESRRAAGWGECPVGLKIEHLWFQHDPSVALFQDFSLEIPAGQKIAIVGASGSGKSTLLQLIANLRTPVSGRLCWTGQDAWQRSARYITQTPSLLHRSIIENLTYGSDEASVERLEEVIAVAGLGSVLSGLPDGWDTMVGDQGACLSGGERQRLHIARGLLEPHGMLLLDEMSGSLDPEMARDLHRRILAYVRGATVVMVTHRLADLVGFDRIIVLQEGRIVEDGTLASLIAKKGLFYRLFDLDIVQISGLPHQSS